MVDMTNDEPEEEDSEEGAGDPHDGRRTATLHQPPTRRKPGSASPSPPPAARGLCVGLTWLQAGGQALQVSGARGSTCQSRAWGGHAFRMPVCTSDTLKVSVDSLKLLDS